MPLPLNAAGGFTSKDKKAMQNRFERKRGTALAGPPGKDIATVLHAFDPP